MSAFARGRGGDDGACGGWRRPCWRKAHRHVKRTERVVVHADELVLEQLLGARPLLGLLAQAEQDEVAELLRKGCEQEAVGTDPSARWHATRECGADRDASRGADGLGAQG